MSFAYQKYPNASPINGKSDGKNSIFVDKLITPKTIKAKILAFLE